MQDKSSADSVLQTLADRLATIDASLERSGFDSCLVDRDWMRAHSSQEEWRDFLDYRREYAREVLLSDSPAKIKHGNPDEHRWQTELIRQRVVERFRRFGDVHDLFQDSSKRHLVELTIPEQRLSRILERASPEDVEECESRHRDFDRRRVQELQKANSDEAIRRAVEQIESSFDSAPRVFAQLLLGRVAAQIGSASATGTRLLPEAGAGECYVDIELDAHPKSGSSSGAIFVTTFYRSGPITNVRRRLAIQRLLPDEFRGYSRFASRPELSVCLAAWLHVAAYMATALIEIGWKPQRP